MNHSSDDRLDEPKPESFLVEAVDLDTIEVLEEDLLAWCTGCSCSC